MSTVVESVPREVSSPRATATLEVPDAPSLPLASPTALSYFAAHPRRPQIYFGDYLLLQTLGEGEFGKVKLGVHRQYGEEAAIKLIKREKVAAAEAEEHAEGSKMSKVEREIRVLKELRHPNIVHLYEVVESERYIGIVLEYGAGGELFDYILAHKCLQERDACRLFAQLVSGVSYLHRKKIIHRDLKLENLLLDRHRNVIITDFGFANDFSMRENDLMATSCGSPCYAAPELVVQDGLYVGAAVDVWSCGVILYAMLAGYLPFDDDPANPDGDNINMLYKYIMATPLTFPDYIGPQPRSLLLRMLVPDPTRRATLDEVMAHPWLAPYRDLFHFTVEELESAAIEQQAKKRQAYRDQMLYQQKLLEQQQAAALPTMSSQQSLSADTLPRSTTASSLDDDTRPGSALSNTETVVDERAPEALPASASAPEPLSMPTPAPAPAPAPVEAISAKPAQSDESPPEEPEEPAAEQPATTEAPAEPSQWTALPLPDVPLPPAPTLPYSATAPALIETHLALSETWRPASQSSAPPEMATKRKSETDEVHARAATKTRVSSEASARAKETAMRRASPRADTKPAPALSYQAAGISMLAPVSALKRDTPTTFGQEPLSLTSFLPQRLGDTRPRKTSVSKAEAHDTSGSKTESHDTSISKAEVVDTSVSKPVVADTPVSKPVVADTPVSKPVVHDTFVNKPVAADTPVSKPVVHDTFVNKPVAADTWTSKPVAADTFVNKPVAADTWTSKPVAADTPVSKPVVADTPVSKPVVHDTFVNKPVAADTWTSKPVVHDTSVSKAPVAEPAMPVTFEIPSAPIKERPSPVSVPAAAESGLSSAETSVPERRVPVSAPVVASSVPVAVPPAPGRVSLDTGMERYAPPVGSAPRSGVWWRRLSGAPNERDSGVRGASLDTSRSRADEERAEQQRLAQARLEGRHRTWSGIPTLEARTALEKRLSVHSGAVDQSALTTRMPDELFMELLQLMQRLGIAVRPSRTEFRIECLRPRRLNALERLFSSHRLETSRRRWSRGGKHAPSAEVEQGLQRMSLSLSTQSLEAFTAQNVPPVYGQGDVDGGHEVRFTVEIARLVRLQGLYSVDIRRLKGNVHSYKFLYDTVLGHLELGTRV